LPYDFQEQLPSTQQEEIFHKFQLQEQFSLFHSKFPQMLHRTQEGIKLPIVSNYKGHFIVFSVITNIYNKKTKGPTLMELFTATGKQKKFFLTTREVRCVHHG
jgi:hypothetical protein